MTTDRRPTEPPRPTGPAVAAMTLGGVGPLLTLVLVLLAVLGLRAVSSLVVPILFGLFLALVASPLIGGLERRGLPPSVALAVAVGIVLLAVLGGAGIVALSIAELVIIAPRYESRFVTLVAEIRDILAGFGIATDLEALRMVLDPGAIASMVQTTAGAVSRTFASILILVFTLVYALTGAHSLDARARAALGDRHIVIDGVERFGIDLRRYLVVRFQLGLFAAVLVFFLLVATGIPLPALWAFLVLAASFIPNVGTILALVPPALLGLLDGGIGTALIVVGGITIVNLAQDYLLQPRLMGTELNLSSLVVFLSIVAWAWVFGPAGALLAVPLTVLLVAILEISPARPLAHLMRHDVDEPPVAVRDGPEIAAPG